MNETALTERLCYLLSCAAEIIKEQQVIIKLYSDCDVEAAQNLLDEIHNLI